MIDHQLTNESSTPAFLMPSFWTRTICADLDDPARKRVLNARLFATIAPRYDFITRALSLGRDHAWKCALVAALPAVDAPRCLDLACGTGDIARLLARRYPAGTVTGIDLTESMLAIARTRDNPHNLLFAQGDMGRLDAPDASMDIVTGGYALRNAPRLSDALAEVRRVLRPGGTAAFLDFSKPPAGTAQRLELALLRAWGGLWGLIVHGDPGVYAYIAHSLARFPDRAAFHAAAEVQGLDLLRTRRFFGGITELTAFRKPAVAETVG
jgi:ubiquinone/menaquinone biosynthesis methyltransferase